jgi:hypothetical protein
MHKFILRLHTSHLMDLPGIFFSKNMMIPISHNPKPLWNIVNKALALITRVSNISYLISDFYLTCFDNLVKDFLIIIIQL